MILRRKIWIGLGAAGAAALTLGLSLGLVFRSENVIVNKTTASKPVMQVNTMREALAVPLNNSDSYVNFFNSRNLSFDNAKQRFVVNFEPFYDASLSALSLGRAYGVVVDEPTYAETTAPLMDEANPILIPNSEATAFQIANPSATISTQGALNSATGLTTFVLPALDASGAPLLVPVVKSNIVRLINPQTGVAREIFDSGVDAERDAEILTAVKFLLAKFLRTADFVGAKVAFVNLVGQGYVSQNNFLAVEAVAEDAGKLTLVSTTGEALAAFQELFSARNLNLTFNRVTTPYFEYITQSEYFAKTVQERARYSLFDQNGEAQFVITVTDIVRVKRPVGKENYYAVYYEKRRERTITSPLVVNANDIDNFLTNLGTSYGTKVRSLLTEHESDTNFFNQAGAVFNNADRKYKKWDANEDNVALNLIRYTPKEVLGQLLAQNRAKTGFSFYGNYGLLPLATKTATNSGVSRDFALILLKILSTRNQWGTNGTAPVSTIFQKVNFANLFRSIPTGLQLSDENALEALDSNNPIVFSGVSVQDDAVFSNGLYLNLVRNYRGADNTAKQRVFTRNDFKQAIFNTTSVSDVELLTFLFLQAAIIDNGLGSTTASNIKLSLPLSPEKARAIFQDDPTGVSYDNGYIILTSNVLNNLAKVLALSSIDITTLNDPNGVGEVKTIAGSETLSGFSQADITAARALVEIQNNAFGAEFSKLVEIYNL